MVVHTGAVDLDELRSRLAPEAFLCASSHALGHSLTRDVRDIVYVRPERFDRRSTADKPAFAVRSQHFTAVGDSLVMCRFTAERGFGLYVGEPYAAMLRAVTGWDVTVEELERAGERIVNLERLFNVREGVRRRDDRLPWRVMHEPIPHGPSAGMHCPPAELDAMLDEYYRLRGWDAEGVPTPARLAALGL